ncbi:MAG: CPBP family intramembrane metalloprotease [Pirellulales bacterium]|nr:CPBP family intramembrane metalloprotease [Pirellulales bacterium]
MPSTTSPADTPLETPRSWHYGALLFAALFPTVGAWIYFIALSGHAWMQPAYAITKGLQFGFPLLWVLAVQKARPGWPLRGSRGVGIGLAFGATIAAIMCAGYFLGLHDMPIMHTLDDGVTAKVRDAQAATPARFLALALFYSLIHSLAEEYYWRWFVYGQMRRVLSLGMANLLSSLAFTAHHILVVWSYLQHDWWAVALLSLGVAVGGAFWAWLYQRSGSLLGPWLSHLLLDAAIMTIGYGMIFGG